MNAEFRPLPLLGNPHLQTILGTMIRSPAGDLHCRERHVTLADGDELLLYDSRPRRWQPGDAIALLVHGLTGSHRSAYLLRLTRMLLPLGYRVVRMDLRGAGRGIRRARRLYNAAMSDDVRTAAAEVHRWAPESPIVAVGFSLGGNLVLKMAGESNGQLVPGLRAVAAVSPPVDPEACCALLARQENRIYDRYFAEALAATVRRHQHYFPDLPPVRFPKNLTLRQFDDLYTAPRGGFADSMDYYRKAAALPLVAHITLPTLLLTARDDPFIACRPIADLSRRAHLDVRIVQHGGHLGFLGFDGCGGIRWAERQLAEWIVATVPARDVQRHSASRSKWC